MKHKAQAKGIRVALDARRQRDNGVARVTRLLASALLETEVTLVLLGPVDVLSEQFPSAEVHEYNAPLLSDEDLYGLDGLLKSLKIDCLIAPQFYNSPWTGCPQVRILHDTFPLELGANLADIQAVESTFGHSRVRRVARALLHDLDANDDNEPALLYRAYYDHSVEKASVLLTVSQQSFESILKHYPAASDKMQVLPLFPDEKTVSSELRAAVDRPIDALHVSKFEPRKNQLTLLRAWRKVWEGNPYFQACIVGSPSTLYPEYTSCVLDAIESGCNEEWLTHHQKIDDRLLAQLYGAAKILCISSIDEGFGLPALEGLANGCIVLALPGTAVEEVCGKVVVLTENSSDSISQELIRLLSNSELLMSLSIESRERASWFPMANTAKALELAICTAVGLTGSRRGTLACD